MHEFAHVLIREAGICANFGYVAQTVDRAKRIESFCNRFAANFLVPAEELRRHSALLTAKDKDLDDVVRALARDFNVSWPVIAGRLLTLSLITRATYDDKLAEWEQNRPAKKKGGRSDPPQSAITGHGVAFTSLVLEAHRKRRVPYSSVADYLDIKPKHVARLEKLLS